MVGTFFIVARRDGNSKMAPHSPVIRQIGAKFGRETICKLVVKVFEHLNERFFRS